MYLRVLLNSVNRLDHISTFINTMETLDLACRSREILNIVYQMSHSNITQLFVEQSFNTEIVSYFYLVYVNFPEH